MNKRRGTVKAKNKTNEIKEKDTIYRSTKGNTTGHYYVSDMDRREIKEINKIAGKAIIKGTSEYNIFIEKHRESLKKLATK